MQALTNDDALPTAAQSRDMVLGYHRARYANQESFEQVTKSIVAGIKTSSANGFPEFLYHGIVQPHTIQTLVNKGYIVFYDQKAKVTRISNGGI